MAIPTFDMYVSKKEYILISKNAANVCGMYIINGVHGPEPRSSGGNTLSNPHVSALIPRPAFNGMEKMCQRYGSNQNSCDGPAQKPTLAVDLWVYWLSLGMVHDKTKGKKNKTKHKHKQNKTTGATNKQSRHNKNT